MTPTSDAQAGSAFRYCLVDGMRFQHGKFGPGRATLALQVIPPLLHRFFSGRLTASTARGIPAGPSVSLSFPAGRTGPVSADAICSGRCPVRSPLSQVPDPVPDAERRDSSCFGSMTGIVAPKNHRAPFGNGVDRRGLANRLGFAERVRREATRVGLSGYCLLAAPCLRPGPIAEFVASVTERLHDDRDGNSRQGLIPWKIWRLRKFRLFRMIRCDLLSNGGILSCRGSLSNSAFSAYLSKVRPPWRELLRSQKK